MVLNYKDVLENKIYLELLKEVPTDLRDKIEKLEQVKRFQFKEYPHGVIIDNTRDHTLRCIDIANNLNIPIPKDTLIRTLWIHDIPELLTKDITVIEKYRKESAAKIFEQEELNAAKILLNKKDQKLLYSFNVANNDLKDNSSIEYVSLKNIPIEFLIAKVIDNSEGNLTFHYYISKWVMSENYKKELLPPKDSLVHTFITNEKFIKKIEKDITEEQSKLVLNFIENVLNTIKGFWKLVPQSRIPKELNYYIDQ